MKRIIYAIIAIAAITGIIAATNNNENKSAILTETKPDTASTEKAAEEQKKAEEAKLAAESFTYTAQPGDSYSVMARKAMQNYLSEANDTLSNAQIVFAETNLTQLAKSPYLEIGDKVTLAKSTLKEWTDKAKTLTTDQIANWNFYAQFANFDTSAVGVAK